MIKLSIQISDSPFSREVGQTYLDRFTNFPAEEADIIIAIGGDGFLLRTLHKHYHLNKPVYGIHCGSIGFLMNSPTPDTLLEHLEQATLTILHPLVMHCQTQEGVSITDFALNEVSLIRQSSQAAKIQIETDGIVRLPSLICDGVLLATPAGSTAYNLSAHGPILPIGTNLLALTPISPFRPRRWRGALLPDTATVKFTILESDKRPVNASADESLVLNVLEVTVQQDKSRGYKLLFDPDHNLEERILREQFLT
ncbi:NAD kinase [Candidatus Paracaedibacter symbiosus]|uniref:NAD kinase n=1 Tax=Candidatus Paracaedibacter symbiosus TaxID=244582 RepID=UPI0005097BF0|nr:NAD kinase [Candidatus Paracaedibacter symbiosus]